MVLTRLYSSILFLTLAPAHGASMVIFEIAHLLLFVLPTACDVAVETIQIALFFRLLFAIDVDVLSAEVLMRKCCEGIKTDGAGEQGELSLLLCKHQHDRLAVLVHAYGLLQIYCLKNENECPRINFMAEAHTYFVEIVEIGAGAGRG